MVTDSTALVMFAIRSGIKLGQQVRLAYVDSTKRRELVLPLPDFFSSPDISSATNYFAGAGKVHVAKAPYLADLLTKRNTPGKVLTSAEESEIIDYHTEFFNLDLARNGKLGAAADGTRVNAGEFNALITIRQWQRGHDPNPPTIQRFAGTFIEIGIDYYLNMPGALNRDSREGKALAGFLQGMSEIRFSEELLGEIPARLFVAALESISENTGLLSADAKVQELVNVATKALSTNIAVRLETIRKDGTSDLVKEERIAEWGELVFRSLLSSAGGLVVSNPKKFLGIEAEGDAALVGRVGESILGLVLDNPDLPLDRIFSRDGLEKVTRSALAVVGEHPEILHLSENSGLQKLLSAIATQLGRYDTLLTPGLLPELTRMILDKTNENLSLVWPDLADNPQRHLLLTAATTVLNFLTQKPADNQKWKPRFSRADLLVVIETVFDELAGNPAWLLAKAGQLNENLGIALDEALCVLRNRADERLSTGTAVEIVCAVVLRAGSRKEFLDKIPAGTEQAGKTLVAAVVDIIFTAIFDEHQDPRVTWQLVRTATIVALVDTGLKELARVQLNPEKVATFTTFIKQLIDSLAAGGPFDLPSFESNLRTMLVDA
jgi:hypothetical protein